MQFPHPCYQAEEMGSEFLWRTLHVPVSLTQEILDADKAAQQVNDFTELFQCVQTTGQLTATTSCTTTTPNMT